MTLFCCREARVIFKPGINRDGYFTAENLLQQVDCAIDIFCRNVRWACQDWAGPGSRCKDCLMLQWGASAYSNLWTTQASRPYYTSPPLLPPSVDQFTLSFLRYSYRFKHSRTRSSIMCYSTILPSCLLPQFPLIHSFVSPKLFFHLVAWPFTKFLYFTRVHMTPFP